jgi:hypothetical protein
VRCDDVGGKTDTKFFRIGEVTKQDSRSEAGEEAGRLLFILLVFWRCGGFCGGWRRRRDGEDEVNIRGLEISFLKSVHFLFRVRLHQRRGVSVRGLGQVVGNGRLSFVVAGFGCGKWRRRREGGEEGTIRELKVY